MKKSISRKAVCFFAQVLLFSSTIIGCCIINNNKNTAISALSKSGQISKSNHKKMVGVWVPYMDLNINSSNNTEQKFKSKFQNIINKSKANKVNALFVQVRPFSDALYPSKVYPWSHLLTGTQGKNPGFDPLLYMVEESHKNGLEFHAWINPFRVKHPSTPSYLSSGNPYFKLNSKKYFIFHNAGLCYNPASTRVQNYIIEGVKEIVQKYNIDGIHFDDYFYPAKDSMTSKDYIYEEYCQKNKNNTINYSEWKIKNVNHLIKEVYKTVKQAKPNVQFGISPSGNIKRCYDLGADVKTWASEKGYVDYLCPQIYWSPDFQVMPFEKTAAEWKKLIKNNNVNLYCGLALYKINSDADKGTWKHRKNIIADEIKISKNLQYNGVILYSWSYLNSESTKQEIESMKKEI